MEPAAQPEPEPEPEPGGGDDAAAEAAKRAQAVAFLADASVEAASLGAKVAYLKQRFGLSAGELLAAQPRPEAVGEATWKLALRLTQFAEEKSKLDGVDVKMQAEMEKLARVHQRCVSELVEVYGAPPDFAPPECPAYRPAPPEPPRSEAEQEAEARLAATVAGVLGGRELEGPEQAEALQHGLELLRQGIHRKKRRMAPQIRELRAARSDSEALQKLHKQREKAFAKEERRVAEHNAETARSQLESLTTFFAEVAGAELPPDLAALVSDGPMPEEDFHQLCESLASEHRARNPRFYPGKLVKQGWVQRNSGHWKFWHRYFAVIRGHFVAFFTIDSPLTELDDAQLRWHTDRQINLSRCALVEPEDDSGSSEFVIAGKSLPSGTLTMRCDTASDKQEWCQCLSEICSTMKPEELDAILRPEELEAIRRRESKHIKGLDTTTSVSRWYVIDSGWLRQWRGFVEGGTRPGRIDNGKLVETAAGGGIQPREGLTKAEHYRAVNPAVWEYFLAEYGGGPEICRATIDIYSPEPQPDAEPEPEPEPEQEPQAEPEPAGDEEMEAAFAPARQQEVGFRSAMEAREAGEAAAEAEREARAAVRPPGCLPGCLNPAQGLHHRRCPNFVPRGEARVVADMPSVFQWNNDGQWMDFDAVFQEQLR